jgi:hypothetical protein
MPDNQSLAADCEQLPAANYKIPTYKINPTTKLGNDLQTIFIILKLEICMVSSPPLTRYL